MSTNNERPRASWEQVAEINGLYVFRSQGGAIKVTSDADGNKVAYMSSAKITQDLLPVFTSEEFKQVCEDTVKEKALNKEREKVTRQINKTLELAQKHQRAAIDQLTASGMTEEQAKKFLKIA